MADKTITIRIDEEQHRAIKVAAANYGITVKEYILNLVKEDLKHNLEEQNGVQIK